MLISKFDTAGVAEKISQLEEQYAITLPSQYKMFLLRYNGGLTPETFFRANKVESDVRAFYGVGNVEYSLDSADLNEWTKRNYFPIACDSFGNEILIGISEASYGEVFFWDHELSKTQMIANDLKTFVKSCKSRKINPNAKKSIAEREADMIAKGRGHVITDTLRKCWQDEIDKFGNIEQERAIIK